MTVKPGGILAIALGSKGKAAESEEEEAAEPEAEESGESEYKSIFVDAAKAGDWEAAFDAIEQCLKGKA